MNDINMSEIVSDVSALNFMRKDPAYLGLALSGEVGELNNLIKKELRASHGFGEDKTNEIATEIPDVMFYLVAIANERNLDFAKMWHEKMNHNELKYGRSILKRPFQCNCKTCFGLRVANSEYEQVLSGGFMQKRRT